MQVFVEGLKYLRDEKGSPSTCVYYKTSMNFCEYSCKSEKNILLNLRCRKHHCPNMNVKQCQYTAKLIMSSVIYFVSEKK
jgi:hypothetical protein